MPEKKSSDHADGPAPQPTSGGHEATGPPAPVGIPLGGFPPLVQSPPIASLQVQAEADRQACLSVFATLRPAVDAALAALPAERNDPWTAGVRQWLHFIANETRFQQERLLGSAPVGKRQGG
jgi:hypothetical protein